MDEQYYPQIGLVIIYTIKKIDLKIEVFRDGSRDKVLVRVREAPA
jgi:hypothetical protein